MAYSRLFTQALGGTALGFLLSRAGLSTWSEVHAMLGLRSPRLYYVFAAAVLASMVFWWSLRRRGVVLRPRPVHAGSVLGAVIFALGWAVSGACPAVAIIQLGEGKALALFTLAGIFLGDSLCKVLQSVWPKFESPGCMDG